MATISSADSASVAATPGFDGWWLKDPRDPSINREVDGETKDTTSDEPQGVFLPLGASVPVVTSSAIVGDAGTVEVLCMTDAEFVGLTALRETQRVLLLQSPEGEQWYVRLGGPFQVHRLVGGVRRVTCPWVEQERP